MRRKYQTEDIVGKRFGMLIALEEVEVPNQPYRYFKCKCDCGNTKNIRLSCLIEGHTISCGCFHNSGEFKRKYNSYSFDGDICTVYTETGESFIIDSDKYDLIKDRYWMINDRGYVFAKEGNRRINLHRTLTNCPNDMVVDHINHIKTDDRMCNLRICTQQQNCLNRTPVFYKDVKGVRLLPNQRYIVIVNSKSYGVFGTLKEASDRYDEIATELFGEFAYLNNYNPEIITANKENTNE